MSRVSWTSLICLSIAAAACAGSPPSSLVDARAAYQRAARGPAEKLAPDQLHAAETSLKTAERTYEAEGDTPTARDRAYVAMRKAQLAEAQAGIVEANLEYEQAQEQTRMAEQRSRANMMSELQATRAELESTSAEQERALAELQKAGAVKQDERGTVLTLSGSVIFASGQTTLLPSARSKIAEVATALQNGDPSAQIVVEGHTDSVGAAEMNKELSLERAQTVRDALVESGVSPDRIQVEGFGEERPVADNGSQDGRANNRRVEIVVQPAS